MKKLHLLTLAALLSLNNIDIIQAKSDKQQQEEDDWNRFFNILTYNNNPTSTAKLPADLFDNLPNDEDLMDGIKKNRSRLKSLTIDQINAFNKDLFARFDNTSLQTFTDAQIAGIYKKIAEAKKIVNLSNAQTSALITSWRTAGAALNDDQKNTIKQLSETQLKGKGTTKGLVTENLTFVIPYLSSSQIEFIDSILTADQVKLISAASDKTLKALNSTQIQALNDTLIKGLTTAQLDIILPKLSSAQLMLFLSKLTAAECKLITADQINGLTKEQLGIITQPQYAGMTNAAQDAYNFKKLNS